MLRSISGDGLIAARPGSETRRRVKHKLHKNAKLSTILITETVRSYSTRSQSLGDSNVDMLIGIYGCHDCVDSYLVCCTQFHIFHFHHFNHTFRSNQRPRPPLALLNPLRVSASVTQQPPVPATTLTHCPHEPPRRHAAAGSSPSDAVRGHSATGSDTRVTKCQVWGGPSPAPPSAGPGVTPAGPTRDKAAGPTATGANYGTAGANPIERNTDCSSRNTVNMPSARGFSRIAESPVKSICSFLP